MPRLILRQPMPVPCVRAALGGGGWLFQNWRAPEVPAIQQGVCCLRESTAALVRVSSLGIPTRDTPNAIPKSWTISKLITREA
eukprot:9366080-Pyramimonas_sp.AAC.1